MNDLIYPSIFGIGASVLLIFLIISCCIRWLRYQKMDQVHSAVNGNPSRQTSDPVAPSLTYPPSYYETYYIPVPVHSPSNEHNGATNRNSTGQSADGIPVSRTVTVAPYELSNGSYPVPLYEEAPPPSYQDVVAAGKALTVTRATGASSDPSPV